MKRVLLLLVVLALLVVGAFLIFSRRGITEGAQLLPADTVFYAAVPDVRRSAERWPKTALAQIGAEQAVADFLKKPVDLVASQGGIEGLDLLFRVKPGRFFVAVTAIRDTGGDAILGFEFFGGQKELDGAMDRFYRELGKSVPGSKRSTSAFQGDTLTTFAGAAPILFSASHGNWGFLSNSEALLKQTLDRAAGRDRSTSLATNTEFQGVVGRLSKDPELLWFGRLKPVVDLLLAIGQKQPNATVNPKQLAQLEKFRALGGTLLFDGAEQKEATFVLCPAAPKLPLADHSPMALASAETTFFYDATMDWKTASSDEYIESLPPEARSFLAGAKIDLKQLPEIFGNDFGVIVNWPSSAMIPAVLAVMEVKDRKRAEGLADSLLASVGVPTTGSELHGARIFGFPTMKIQLIDPSVAIGDKFVFASLTGRELERALSTQSGTPILETSKAFQPALAAYKAGGQAFGYLDSKALFESIYNRVRPIALFAATMSADVGKFVDISKLPETETISRHLSPIIYTNKQLADGWLIESSGPVTLSQVFFVVGGGAGAAYISQAIKSHQH
ncbi:MAG: hypothetical protein PHC88_13425 [Terrimicrobiaceae bacterium]|nr:hypothetical protein [Terrimicrobiaceae bacterium]